MAKMIGRGAIFSTISGLSAPAADRPEEHVRAFQRLRSACAGPVSTGMRRLPLVDAVAAADR
jgi:hypothetical protein